MPHKVGLIVIPTFQGQGQQLREVVELALGHTASMPQSHCPPQFLLTAESIQASSWARSAVCVGPVALKAVIFLIPCVGPKV